MMPNVAGLVTVPVTAVWPMPGHRPVGPVAAPRRSAVRTFVRRGTSVHTAMALSGHKTSSVFRRYDIVSPEDLWDAAWKLDSAPNRDAAAR